MAKPTCNLGRGRLTINDGTITVTGNVNKFSVEAFQDDTLKHQDMGNEDVPRFYDEEIVVDGGWRGSFTVDTDLKNALEQMTTLANYVNPTTSLQFTGKDPTKNLGAVSVTLTKCVIRAGNADLITEGWASVSYGVEARTSKGAQISIVAGSTPTDPLTMTTTTTTTTTTSTTTTTTT